MTNCPKKKCFLSALAIFVFMLVYDKILHQHLLVGMYKQTESLWRPVEEMKEMLPWMLGQYVLLALLITCFYGKCKAACAAQCEATGSTPPCPMKHGICFGFAIGLFMALVQTCVYFHMPIPLELATAWFLGSIVKGIGIGIVLGLICSLTSAECKGKNGKK